MNAELCKDALVKVGNPNVLVNLVSRRVRQLNSGAGGTCRPLILESGTKSATDIAFLEIIQDKIGWELPEELPTDEPRRKRVKRKR